MNNPTKGVSIRVKNLKKGYRITESDLGHTALMEVLEDAKEVNSPERKRFGHECLVRVISDTSDSITNQTITLFEATDSCGPYCLKLRLVGRLTQTESDTITPCPFCGNTNLEVGRGTPDKEGTPVYIYCEKCGMQGPWVYSKNIEIAVDHVIKITNWNNRHN